MTRLAFGLDGWETRDYRGEAPLTEDAIEEHSSTFLNARLWDYRPLGDTLDQLQTVRQYYDFVDVDTDRYQFGDDDPPGHALGPRVQHDEEPARRAGSTTTSSTPTASASRWSRSTRSRRRASRSS